MGRSRTSTNQQKKTFGGFGWQNGQQGSKWRSAILFVLAKAPERGPAGGGVPAWLAGTWSTASASCVSTPGHRCLAAPCSCQGKHVGAVCALDMSLLDRFLLVCAAPWHADVSVDCGLSRPPASRSRLQPRYTSLARHALRHPCRQSLTTRHARREVDMCCTTDGGHSTCSSHSRTAPRQRDVY